MLRAGWGRDGSERLNLLQSRRRAVWEPICRGIIGKPEWINHPDLAKALLPARAAQGSSKKSSDTIEREPQTKTKSVRGVGS